MEQILSPQQGVSTLLASICVILAFHLILKVGEFVWEIVKKKSEVTEKSLQDLTSSVQDLKISLRTVERELAQMPKFKEDLRRYFEALKIMAGENWKNVRKSITEEEVDS